MKLDELYPTGSTTYGIETTAPFMSIPDLIDKMGDQYLMGYVPSDGMGVEAVDITNTGDIITMSRKPGNFGWGYCQWGYNSGAGPGTIYYNDNGTLVRSWGINYDCAFINAAEMCRLNTRPGMSIYLSVASVHNNLIDGNKMTQFANFVSGQVGGVFDGWLDFTIDQYHDIIKNDTPFFDQDISIPNEGVTVHLTIRPSDFDNDDGLKFVLIPTGYDFVLHCRIPGFRLNESKYYYDSANIYTNNIMPFFQIPHNDGKMILMPGSLDLSYINITYSNGSITAGRGIGGDSNNKYIQNGDNATIFGAFDFGELSVNDIDFTRVFSSSGGHWAFVRNYVFVTTSTGSGTASFRVNAMYTPRDVYNYIRFFHKRTDTPSDTYSASDTVTVFETSETPTFETVSGTLSEIAARLRPWQMPNVDITANTFTPEDIPDPSPEPSYDEESGDTIDFIKRSFSGASNFITNYAMTRHHVGVFGNRLWTSWVDSLGNPTEMIKNIRIFYTGGDTGSIDIGSVMPFIVSMKIFPFDLSNFIGYETNGIKIGTGHYPIEVPGCWYLPRSSVYVSCGTVTIPRIFNDFRDYENMNIMCYVPYCGTVELNPGDVIGRTLSCTYGVDLQSGGCTAYIIVDNNYPVATISGQMGSSVPLTATNSGQLMSQRLSDISGASALIGNTTMQVQRESERPHPKQENMDSAIVGAVLQAADSVPQRFRRSAISCPTMSAGNGLDAFAQPPTPYIQMRYGIYDLPANYKHSIGRISTKSNRLSEYKDSGFITCSNVDTSPLNCHNDEKAAIKAALESGVYI